MKKKYLFTKGAKRWNNLLSKFTKLQKRLQSPNIDTRQYARLVNKLKQIFSKLEKMQYQTGIKVAGTSLALILSTFTANAQFAAGAEMKYTGDIYNESINSSAFADVDGDGDEDLYVGTSNGFVEQYTNNNGTFTYAGLLQASGTDIDAGSYAAPEFADLDSDGDLDLYVGATNGNVAVFTNNNGVFTAAGFIQVGGADLYVGNTRSTPHFADVDADGDLDLYVGNYPGEVKVFTNNSGVFTTAGDFVANQTMPSITIGESDPEFADIDGDGDLDLYLGTNNGFIALLTNNNGVFTYTGHLQTNLNVDIDPGMRTRIDFADTDNDGDLDLYVNAQENNIYVYTNNGGVFTDAGIVQAEGLLIDAGYNAMPTFADIDTDGDLDLYIGGYDGEIKVFTNNNGVFTAAAALQAGSTIDVGSAASPTFADLDNDGDLDLYVGEYYGDIKFFSNNNGIFTAGTDLVTASGNFAEYYTAPAFADIDGDGDLDLYSGQYYGEISVFTNNAGSFTQGNDLQAGGVDIDLGFRGTPTFADADGDGDLDLYAGNHNGIVKMYINNSGVFAAGANLQAAGVDISMGASWSKSSPSFADLDGDGDLDLYVGNGAGNIIFYENTTISAILVSSITIQGTGNVNTISTPGGTLQMQASVLPANADDGTYTWSVANGTGSATIDANGLLTALTDGTVNVTATANDVSGESATMVVTISNQSVGLNNNEISKNIKLYPNPVSNQLFIEMEGEQINQLEIVDYTGRAIQNITEANTTTISVSNLKQGVYFLKTYTKHGIFTKQFIKK